MQHQGYYTNTSFKKQKVQPKIQTEDRYSALFFSCLIKDFIIKTFPVLCCRPEFQTKLKPGTHVGLSTHYTRRQMFHIFLLPNFSNFEILILSICFYHLTIFRLARMGSSGSDSIAHETEGKIEWAIDSEAMRARKIIVLVKSNQFVKNIETKQLQLAKRDSATIVLIIKAGAFRYQWVITHSLVVAQPIKTQH